MNTFADEGEPRRSETEVAPATERRGVEETVAWCVRAVLTVYLLPVIALVLVVGGATIAVATVTRWVTGVPARLASVRPPDLLPGTPHVGVMTTHARVRPGR